MQQSMMTSRRR